METSSDEEVGDTWANFTTPLEHDGDRQSIPTVRQLSQVDKEDQKASSQQKVSPISTYLLYSLTLNFQRIFCQKIRLSGWINEGSELIEAHLEVKVVQSEYFFIDPEEETSDAEVEEDETDDRRNQRASEQPNSGGKAIEHDPEATGGGDVSARPEFST